MTKALLRQGFFDCEQTFVHNGKMQEEEDVKIEPEMSEEAGEMKPEDKIAKMREELGACRKEKQEYMDGWQRAKADYVNLLKRIETGAKMAELKGRVGAVETLLPAFDALERAKEHGDVPDGFMGIAKQLESAFALLGLEEIGKIGEKFNPAVHEALGQDKVESAEEDDTITAILEKGWRVGDNIIRPAKVRVGHFN
ncbi:MAG TPA: nucleotide exchange factor GrpE [Candidatus Paceibacterota bacterium]